MTGLRCAALALLTGALLSLPPQALAQQTVRGTVVEGSLGTPISGAMVVVLEDGRSVTQVLTWRDGSFIAAVQQPGRYQLRVDRIGYTSTYTDVFDLPAGATVVQDVATTVEAVSLPAIEVESAPRCEVRPTRGAAGVVWEEMRKALAVTAVSTDDATYRFVWTRYVRDFGPDGLRVSGDERSVRQGVMATPFASVDAEVLRREGFVHTRPEGEIYVAPDAHVLLSDAFLDSHCFSLERSEESGDSLVGLRFEPVSGRDLREVEGVLWLEQNGLRLRSMAYRYVNLGRTLERDDASGEMAFRELPNGSWFVQRWSIRIPRLQQVQGGPRQPFTYQVSGYREEGAIVGQVTTSAGEVVLDGEGWPPLRGRVLDPSGRPASGVRVWVEGSALEVVSDRDGAFVIPGLGPGIWRLGASHPALEAVGHTGTLREVAVAQGSGNDALLLELPSVRALAAEKCRDTPSAVALFDGRALVRDEAVILGRVIDTDGQPVSGAQVRIRWNRYVLPGVGSPDGVDPARMSENWEEYAFETGADGAFVVCTAPTERWIHVSGTIGDRSSPPMELLIEDGEDVVAIQVSLVR